MGEEYEIKRYIQSIFKVFSFAIGVMQLLSSGLTKNKKRKIRLKEKWVF